MSRKSHHLNNNQSKSELIKVRENGNIKTMSMTTISSRPAPTTIEATTEYKKFAKLKDEKIGVGEAARKYNVPQPTISRWVKLKYIPVLGREGKQKLLLDESYVAYCSYVFNQNRGQGKTPFNQNGTPFVPKTIRPNGNDKH